MIAESSSYSRPWVPRSTLLNTIPLNPGIYSGLNPCVRNRAKPRPCSLLALALRHVRDRQPLRHRRRLSGRLFLSGARPCLRQRANRQRRSLRGPRGRGQPRDTNLNTYTILRTGGVPDIDFEFVRSTETPVGLGEPATTTVASAIREMRFLPLAVPASVICPIRPEAVLQALARADPSTPRILALPKILSLRSLCRTLFSVRSGWIFGCIAHDHAAQQRQRCW